MLHPYAFKAAELGAEADAIDAELERWAVAMEEALEKGFQLEGADDILLDFDELASGEFFPPRADGGVVAKAAQEKLDFSESEAHFGGETDKEHAGKGIACIPPLASLALWRGEEAAFFVVADGRSVEAGVARELADFHNGVPDPSLPKNRLT